MEWRNVVISSLAVIYVSVVLAACVVYPALRFCWNKTWRAASRTRLRYHTAVTRDWWAARATRTTLHRADRAQFVITPTQSQHGLDRVGVLADRTYIKGPTGITRTALLAHIGSALLCDEVYVRVAHYSHDGHLANYTIDRANCVNCAALLPVDACFVAGHYWCLSCIKAHVVPHHCGIRLALLLTGGELSMLPPELCRHIARLMLYLCFDWCDDGDEDKCRRCYLWDCRTEERGQEVRALRRSLGDYCAPACFQ
jgi:hypothetical protein